MSLLACFLVSLLSTLHSLLIWALRALVRVLSRRLVKLALVLASPWITDRIVDWVMDKLETWLDAQLNRAISQVI